MKLEEMKLRFDLQKCQTARMELQLRICEREEDIKRLQDHIKLQDDREIDLKKQIQALVGG